MVPKGTRVGGPPLPGPDGGEPDPAAEEVVFETESPLVCTAATLVAAWASDTETDTAADRSAVATGTATGADDVPFGLFGESGGMALTPHELYLACDPLFDLAAKAAADAARAALATRAADAAKAADTARAAAVLRSAAAMRAAAAAGRRRRCRPPRRRRDTAKAAADRDRGRRGGRRGP